MIIEDTSILNQRTLEEMKSHLYLPLTYNTVSTTDKFPFYGHTLSSRPDLNIDDEDLFDEDSVIQVLSPAFTFYRSRAVDPFCKKHGIKYKNIIRSCINSSYYIPGYKFLDPHVDYTSDHLVFLLYMNTPKNCNPDYNATVIFEREYSKGEPFVYDLREHDQDSFKIKREVYPQAGKILCFDGKYYHSNRPASPGENRFVCVFNLLI